MANSELNSVEQVATCFVADELAAARTSLRRAKIGFVVGVLFVAGYMSFLLITLQTRLLRAEPAAALATQYARQAVQQNGQELSAYLIKEVPAFVHELPDQLIARLPALRVEIEARAETTLQTHVRDLTTQLGDHLESFLSEHQDEVKTFFQASKDPQFVRTFGDNLEGAMTRLLQTRNADGKSVNDCLAEGLTALQSVEARLDRLAHATNLTPEEKRLRRVIALTINMTDRVAVPVRRPAPPQS